jgi:hypothetical protein
VSFEHWSYVPTEGVLPVDASVTVGDRVAVGLSGLGLSVVVVATVLDVVSTVVVVEATVDDVDSFVDVVAACVLDVVASVLDVVASVLDVVGSVVDVLEVELLSVDMTEAGETPAAAAPSANSARLRTAPAKRRRQALAVRLGLRLMMSSWTRAPRRRRRL